jgi:hypothetical protein
VPGNSTYFELKEVLKSSTTIANSIDLLVLKGLSHDYKNPKIELVYLKTQLELFTAKLICNLLAKSKPLISLHLLVLLEKGFYRGSSK